LPNSLTSQDRTTLHTIAKESIDYSLQYSPKKPIEDCAQLSSYSASLQSLGASFVTLTIQDKLRGCIGSLEANQPLVIDVMQNARSAAFFDPRFPPVTQLEFNKLTIQLSVLSLPQAMSFTSEKDLLRQIQPGIDGLVLEDGNHRATFLPSVWETLPDANAFLRHLKQKAGVSMDYWSDTITCARYTTECF